MKRVKAKRRVFSGFSRRHRGPVRINGVDITGWHLLVVLDHDRPRTSLLGFCDLVAVVAKRAEDSCRYYVAQETLVRAAGITTTTFVQEDAPKPASIKGLARERLSHGE